MTVWLVVLLGGVATYFLRTSFIVFMGNRALPVPVERALRYVGPAAFAAIAMPGIFGSNDDRDLWMPDERIVAAAVCGVICWRSKQLVAGLAAGMCTLWLLQAL